MAQNVADDLRWRAALDLTGCMRVPKHVGAQEGSRHASDGRMAVQPVSDRGRPTEPDVGQMARDEDVAIARVTGTLVAQIF